MLRLETKQDLQRLIDDGVKEDLRLEFKGGPALDKTDKERNEMAKDISAMANADGGQIVYGLREDKTRGVPTEFWPIDGRRFGRETVEQVARSKISPAIEGLEVRTIPLNEDASEVAFVIGVPRAIGSAPHQSADHKYYRRRGTTVDPMEDYEVREAMRRSVDPDLYADLGFEMSDWVSEHRLNIRPTLFNRSIQPALYCALTIFADTRLGLTHSAASPFNPTDAAKSKHPNGFNMHAVAAHLAAPEHFPIFRGHGVRIHDSIWSYRNSMDKEHFGIGYRLAAPGCEIEEYFVLRADDKRLVFKEKAG